MITSLIKVGILSLVSFGSSPFSVCAPDYSESVAHIESEPRRLPQVQGKTAVVIDGEYFLSEIDKVYRQQDSNYPSYSPTSAFTGTFFNREGTQFDSLVINYSYSAPYYNWSVMLYESVNHIGYTIYGPDTTHTQGAQMKSYFWYQGYPSAVEQTSGMPNNYYLPTWSLALGLFNSGSTYASFDGFNVNGYYNQPKPSTEVNPRNSDEDFYYNYVLKDGLVHNQGSSVRNVVQMPYFSVNGGNYVYNAVIFNYRSAVGYKIPERAIYNTNQNTYNLIYREGDKSEIFFWSLQYAYVSDFSDAVNSIVAYNTACLWNPGTLYGETNVIGAGGLEWYTQEYNLLADSYYYNGVVDNSKITFYTNNVSAIDSAIQRMGLSINGSGSVIVIDNESGFWLTNAFTLIQQAYTGLFGMFNVQVLPGISLGTLLFVPFAVTIILFIIKLFKR